MSQKKCANVSKLWFHGLILIVFGKQHKHTSKNDTCDTVILLKMIQSSSFSRKYRTLSLQVCQTVQLTTEFVDWCRNVCTLHKHLSVPPAAVTSNLKQRLIDIWASISQNVIDKAVRQWKKQLHASMKANDITLNIC